MEAVLNILAVVLLALLGGLALWFKGSGTLRGLAAELILEAEEYYKDVTKAGGEKFEWVVSSLYQYLPAVIRPFIPRTVVETIVQTTFNAVEQYAKLQLDKLSGGLAVTAAAQGEQNGN